MKDAHYTGLCEAGHYTYFSVKTFPEHAFYDCYLIFKSTQGSYGSDELCPLLGRLGQRELVAQPTGITLPGAHSP